LKIDKGLSGICFRDYKLLFSIKAFNADAFGSSLSISPQSRLLTGSFRRFRLEVAVDAGVYQNNQPLYLAD
jgi:hypothetical protein